MSLTTLSIYLHVRRATAGLPLSVPDDSVLAASVRPASPAAASTAYLSVASAPRSPLGADAVSRTRCAVPSPGRQSTASSARQHSASEAAAFGENAAGAGGSHGGLVPNRRMRTTKRAGQHVKRSDAVRVEVEQVPAAASPSPQQAHTEAAVRPPGGQWWEQPQPIKPNGQTLDATELILGGLTAAKTRNAINLTANATVGEPLLTASFPSCSSRLQSRVPLSLSTHYPVASHRNCAYLRHCRLSARPQLVAVALSRSLKRRD